MSKRIFTKKGLYNHIKSRMEENHNGENIIIKNTEAKMTYATVSDDRLVQYVDSIWKNASWV